jgi:hypothetical protein
MVDEHQGGVSAGFLWTNGINGHLNALHRAPKWPLQRPEN